MAVAESPAARGDLVLHRAGDQSVGVRWEQDRLDGAGYVPVDMLGWSARLALFADGAEVASFNVRCTGDGMAMADIPDGALGADEFSDAGGQWEMTATPPDDSRVELLGHGFWRCTR